MSPNSDLITLSSFPRAIAHVDCDAFFASCEQARDPRLKGKPVVTGAERGIIACASYEAKALGIRRGVRLSDAKKLCPGLVVLPSDYETYSLYSENVFSIMRRFTPEVEEFSIDEAFCDLTGLRRVYRMSYGKIAISMKEAIKKELDITVSIGLSLSKTLAKMGSRRNKPNGFTAIPGYAIHEFLGDALLEDVCGFGPNTVALLQKCGINTVPDYVKRPVEFARRLLGKIGEELWLELRGNCVYRLCSARKEKYLSIMKSKTFVPESSEKDFVRSQLMRNLEAACIKLRRHGLSASTVTAYLRRSDFGGESLEAKLSRHASSAMDFTAVCSEMFERLIREGTRYRATGIILSGIAPEGADSRTLFDDPVKIERIKRLSESVDEINKKYGKYAVHLACADAAISRREIHPRNVRPLRMNELLKGETLRKRLNIPLLKLL